MSESMSANHRRKHAKSSKSEMCDLEASSSSMSLIREDARNALWPPPKTTTRRSSRREHDRKRPEKGKGGHRDRRKAEEAMSMDVSMSRSARCQPSKRTSRRSSSRKHERNRPDKGNGGGRDGDRRRTERAESMDASVATPRQKPRRRSKHRDLSGRDSLIWDRSTRTCRCNDEEERREVVEKEIKHVKKNANVCEYDSMNPTWKRLDSSNRKHRGHAQKIDEEQYVSSSPMHSKLEYSSDLLWDGSRTCKCSDEEERREVAEKEIKHVKRDAKVDHCEYDSIESTSIRLDLSGRKHDRHTHKINEEQYVSSTSPVHNRLESSEYYKNNKIKSMHGDSPRRSKQLMVHRNNGRNKNRIVADHRTYIGPSMFLDDSGQRSFAHRMISDRPRRDQQWKEGRLKRLKNKMAIIFHHHHHHHHRHGRLVEVLERLAKHVWKPEKGVAERRRGNLGLSSKSAKQRCLWWPRGGGGGVKVARRRQQVLLLSRRRSQKKMATLGYKKGKRS